MKSFLLRIALSAVFASSALQAASFGSVDTSYSHPTRYMSMLRSSDWRNSGELTEDWGGPRNTLYDERVSVFANYTNNIAGNPVGGESAGFTYCDNISFGIDLDLGKLIGWKGGSGSVTVSGLNRDGSSLSEKNVGNQFTVQQVFGVSAVMFYGLYLDQKLWDDRISIKVGRYATGDDFASSPIYWLFSLTIYTAFRGKSASCSRISCPVGAAL